MSSPLAGTGGKPIIGVETPGMHFVGCVVIELFEGSSIISDGNGLVLSINPGIGTGIDPEDLLKRIAAALSARIPKLAAGFERQRKMQQEMAGPEASKFLTDQDFIRIDSRPQPE
jgi:hypothetical protein